MVFDPGIRRKSCAARVQSIRKEYCRSLLLLTPQRETYIKDPVSARLCRSTPMPEMHSWKSIREYRLHARTITLSMGYIYKASRNRLGLLLRSMRKNEAKSEYNEFIKENQILKAPLAEGDAAADTTFIADDL